MSELLGRTLGETIQLETVLAGGLWRVEADPNQLENAILNLAVNARDAMPGGGKLTIETANTHFDQVHPLRPGICRSECGGAAGSVRGDLRQRHGPWHGQANDGAGVRAVLHH
jgi:hypothetical protein